MVISTYLSQTTHHSFQLASKVISEALKLVDHGKAAAVIDGSLTLVPKVLPALQIPFELGTLRPHGVNATHGILERMYLRSWFLPCVTSPHELYRHCLVFDGARVSTAKKYAAF